MTRVIQDSDDELDDDLLPEEHQAGRDAPPKQSTGDASSTGKCENQSAFDPLTVIEQRLYENK